MAMKRISITDVKGFKLGNAENKEKGTGCTVIVCEEGAVGGVDVRGGGPATRETDLLRSENTVNSVNAVVLSGGSAFGLEAASGVMRELADLQIGFNVGDDIVVPIVCGASLYDLPIGDPKAFPDVNMGAQAVRNAFEGFFIGGNHGAGTGATVGKMKGYGRAMKSGLGSFACGDGIVEVGAIAAVNAVGDIYNGAGNIIAGLRSEDGKTIYGTIKALKSMVHDKVKEEEESVSFINKANLDEALAAAARQYKEEEAAAVLAEGSTPEATEELTEEAEIVEETAPEVTEVTEVTEEPAAFVYEEVSDDPSEAAVPEAIEENEPEVNEEVESEVIEEAEEPEEPEEEYIPEAPEADNAVDNYKEYLEYAEVSIPETSEKVEEEPVVEEPSDEVPSFEAQEEIFEEPKVFEEPVIEAPEVEQEQEQEQEEMPAAEDEDFTDEIPSFEAQEETFEEPEVEVPEVQEEPEEEAPVVLSREDMGYDITFNTTISCLITNASLTKSQANKLASILHDAYARAIKPVHGTLDGDTVFVLATGKQEVNFDAFAALATDIMQYAIIDGAMSAESAYGLPAARDM